MIEKLNDSATNSNKKFLKKNGFLIIAEYSPKLNRWVVTIQFLIFKISFEL